MASQRRFFVLLALSTIPWQASAKRLADVLPKALVEASAGRKRMTSVANVDVNLADEDPDVAEVVANDTKPLSDVSSDHYKCGEVPREVLVKLGLVPKDLATVRCPRGQSGDQQGLERHSPDELEFFMCGLVSTRKFVVWTPHFFMNSYPEMPKLFSWAHKHTTCDFADAVACQNGFVSHHAKSGTSQTRCLPHFDITSQPLPKHMLVDVAITIFEATAQDAGIDELSPAEAHMAFGVILGYPKFATRDFFEGWSEMAKTVKDFDSSYAKAVKWILTKLSECCQNTEVFRNIAAWPTTTDQRPPSF